MKENWITTKGIYSLLLSLFLILSACQQMSETETEKSAGLNGGFEISKNDLPVNWHMYSPKTVPNADFEISLDKEIYKEGSQSLRFKVKDCKSEGGWHSPGFTNEFVEAGRFNGPNSYRLSFWIMNTESRFRISGGAIDPMEGEMKTLVEGSSQIEDWKFHEFIIEVPQDKYLRMELNILDPGTFWIDDVNVEKL